MRKYLEMAKAMVKVDAAYTAWYWAGSASTILRMLVIYAFWHAVYQNRATLGDITLQTMVTYIVLAALLNNFTTGVSSVGKMLAFSVRDGSIAIELMRPYDVLNKYTALDIGYKCSGFVRDALPMMVVAYLFMGIEPPASWEAGSLSLLSAAIGMLIATYLDMILGIAAFWLNNIWGLSMLRNAVYMFFTGALIPVSLFPDWLQTVSRFLPFQSMIYVPVSVYTGQLGGGEAYLAMGLQVFWLAAVVILIRMAWSVAMRRVTIFGG